MSGMLRVIRRRNAITLKFTVLLHRYVDRSAYRWCIRMMSGTWVMGLDHAWDIPLGFLRTYSRHVHVTKLFVSTQSVGNF